MAVVNLLCWPLLFVRQIEQLKISDSLLEKKLEDISNRISDKEEDAAVHSPESISGTNIPSEDGVSENESVGYQIEFKRYSVDGDKGIYLYAIENAADENNVFMYDWQMSEDGGETWISLLSDGAYIVLAPKEAEEYRVVVYNQETVIASFPIIE